MFCGLFSSLLKMKGVINYFRWDKIRYLKYNGDENDVSHKEINSIKAPLKFIIYNATYWL